MVLTGLDKIDEQLTYIDGQLDGIVTGSVIQVAGYLLSR